MKRTSALATVAAVVILIPLGYSVIASVAAARPDVPDVFLEKPDEGECVDDTEFMRYQHMDLLLELRDAVVREGERGEIVREADGVVRAVTLDGCWECHTERSTFCDRCHTAVNLNLDIDCFRCHHDPTSDARLAEVVSSLNRGDENEDG